MTSRPVCMAAEWVDDWQAKWLNDSVFSWSDDLLAGSSGDVQTRQKVVTRPPVYITDN